MRLALLLILFVWPFLEITLFLSLGDEIGFINTIFLYILMAIVGGAMIYWQGISTLIDLKDGLESDVFPSRALFDAACLAIAGVLMILPGFFSDAIAIALLLPPVRHKIRDHLAKGKGYRPPREPDIIEGSYSRIDTDKP